MKIVLDKEIWDVEVNTWSCWDNSIFIHTSRTDGRRWDRYEAPLVEAFDAIVPELLSGEVFVADKN